MHLYIIMNEDTMMKGVLEWGVNFTPHSHVTGTWLVMTTKLKFKKFAIPELSLGVILLPR
jgi:hypothetical protein